MTDPARTSGEDVPPPGQASQEEAAPTGSPTPTPTPESDAGKAASAKDDGYGGAALLERPSTVWLVAAGLMVAAYILVNVLYGLSTARPALPVINEPDHVVVYVNPVSVVPAEDKVRTKVTVDPPDSLLNGDKLNKKLSVVFLIPARTFTYEKGAKNAESDLDIFASNGSYEMYPFDRYENLISAYSVVIEADGSETFLPTDIIVWGKFPGWRVFPTTSHDALPAGWEVPNDLRAQLKGIPVASLQVARNGSTMTFVVLLLIAMLVLTAFALVVARTVAARQRRIEATMASWFAALLFAMVPLRTNMPGAPPIGVWIDFLVFMWVILGLMLALAVFIGSWLRYSPPPTSDAAK